MTIKGSLLMSITIVKAFLSRQKLDNNFRFGDTWVEMYDFVFRTQKVASSTFFDVLTVKISAAGLAIERQKNSHPKK